MSWKEKLEKNDPSAWERSFRTTIQRGAVAIDKWLWHWLWYRIEWPDRQYSLFKKGKILLDASIFSAQVVVKVGHHAKKRNIQFCCFEGNPYHPNFEARAEASDLEWRFPSSGNPFIDDKNYEYWEKLLFCKLFYQVLEDEKGLDFLIERARRFH